MALSRLSLQWKWNDLWMGFYYDIKNHALYVCPLPTLVLKFDFSKRPSFTPVKTIYVNNQEYWWGSYNSNHPYGDDIKGDGSLEKPFRSVIRSQKAAGPHGLVRNMQSQLLAFGIGACSLCGNPNSSGKYCNDCSRHLTSHRGF
jgi:hypothetical protein